MTNKKLYQTDFYPVFHTINQCIDQLDQLGIVKLVGKTRARAFADSFVQLVFATWDAIPFDAPMSSSSESHGLDPKTN